MQYLKEFEENEKKEGRNISTIKAYASNLKQFEQYLKKEIEEITKDDIDNYKKYLMNDKKIKPKTINGKLISIRKYVNYINANDNIDLNIFVNIKLLKIQNQEYLSEMLTKNEVDRLIRRAEREGDRRAVAIFKTLYFTGMRVSEMLQMKVEDVGKKNFEVMGKGEKYRKIFVPDKLKDYLEIYLKNRGYLENKYLFNNTKNGALTRQQIHAIIKHYAGLCRIKLSKAHAHNFRHLYCMTLVDKGVSIDQIADLAGHSNINTTRIYTRKTESDLYKTINSL